MVESLFLQLGAILILATLLGLLCHKLNQPLYLAYVLTGALMAGVGIAASTPPQTLQFLSELGIAFLLFLVGLELRLTEIRKLGRAITITGLSQMLVTGLIGFVIAVAFGADVLTAGYIGLSLTLCSTIITIKRLYDSQTAQSVYGRIGIGLMLVQDMVALVLLVALSGMHGVGHSGIIGLDVALMASKAATLVVASYVVSHYVLPSLFRQLAGSVELLLLGSIGWCITLGAVAIWSGFTVEIGAFLAGLALASSAYQYQISVRIRPLRDFFITIFFIILGLGLSWGILQQMLVPALALSLVVIIVNPMVVMVMLGRLGYKKHVFYRSGLLTTHIGEFALKIMVVGLALGHLTQPTVALMTLTVIITLVVSSYLAIHQESIYRWLKPLLVRLEQESAGKRRIVSSKPLKGHSILVGCSSLGLDILHALQKHSNQVVVIDYDPAVVEHFNQQNVTVIYGDVTDEDVLQEAGIEEASLIISTVDDRQSTLYLLNHHSKVRQDDIFIVTAMSIAESLEYYRLGADYVIVPHQLSGQLVSEIVEQHGQDKKAIDQLRLEHVMWLTHVHIAGMSRFRST